MIKYFVEHASYIEGDEKEKEEAIQYLISWKKFFLRKLQRDSYQVKIIEEQWIERPAYLNGCLNNHALIALKIAIEANYFYDLENM